MTWPTKKLGDKEYFEILESGVEKFEGEKEYLSTSSIEKNKIIASEGKITYQKRPSRANMQPRVNSVWFARMINTIKVYSFTEKNKDEVNKYILSTGFAGILCNTEKVNPLYLEKIFLSDWFNNLKDNLASDKAIQKSLNNEDIKILEIPLPPLPIQQKIVKILDTIQSAVEIQEKIIEKTKELKKSLMNLLFHYGIKALSIKLLTSYRVGELRSEELEKLGFKLKKTEIGEIPEYWDVVRLGEICEIYSGGNAPQEAKYFENGQYPFIRVQHFDGEKPYVEKWDLINEEAIKKYNLKLFPAETIIFPKSGASIQLEKRAKLKIPAYIVNHLCGLIINQNKANIDFIFNYLKTIKFFESSGGSTLPYLNISKISKIPTPLPPLPEQQKIAEILQTIDQKIEIEKRKKELYEELFKTMLNKIMSQEIDIEKIEI